jgi:3-methyl-2-oxobutanoate hydroxymethyltransferase
VTGELAIPTIGIGAGAGTDGQVLVWHDMLGLYEGTTPRFVKAYATIAPVIRDAVAAYADDVRGRRFPEGVHTYAISDEELEAFEHAIASRAAIEAP